MDKEQRNDKTRDPEAGDAAPDANVRVPRLNEPDDFDVRFRLPPDSPEETWKPGVVEVEFKESLFTDRSMAIFSQPVESAAYPGEPTPGLRLVLDDNRLERWKLSFPLLYPWSTDEPEKALEFYLTAGRDRFITFYFPHDADVLRIAAEFEQLPEVEHAAPVPGLAPPSSPLEEPLVGFTDQLMSTVCGPGGCLDNQWYIFRCKAEQAWEKATGRDVVIADIDWGFNLNHGDLNTPRVEFRRNVFENSIDVARGSRIGHGTAVLALAGAGANGLGMAGFAHGARLWAIQAGSNSVENHDFWVSAIDLVRSRNSQGSRKIILLEIQTRKLGNIEMCVKIRKAIIDAIDNDVVVCVPAGNGVGDAGIGDDGKEIPPTGSILVGATRYDAQKNERGVGKTGQRIVVYAPGDVEHDLTCSVPGPSDYRNRFGGTSGATAKVAGTVALMLEVNRKLTQKEICDILRQSTTTVSEQSSTTVIGVLLDAKQAVEKALEHMA